MNKIISTINEIIITLIAFIAYTIGSMNKQLTRFRGMNGRIAKVSRIFQQLFAIFQRRSYKKGQRFQPTEGNNTTIMVLR